jgi:hypothetical protein
MMKGFTKDNKFHPIIDYKAVKKSERKKKEPFPVTTDGVKLSRLELIQMQRADIGRGRRYAMDMPIPMLETELTDIFADVERIDSIHHQIDYGKLNKVVEDNIKFILNRERLLGNDEYIGMHHVSSRQEIDGDSGFYQYDFFIYKGNKRTKFGGTAYGSISAGDVIDMNLELYKERNN